MRLEDLNESQKLELKQRVLGERNDAQGKGTSWAELAMADELVSDEELADKYGGTEFVPEDFSKKPPENPIGGLQASDWQEEALKYAESIGIYEYEVNDKYIEYWSFFGRHEGWYFVRYDLEKQETAFRGANIPWDDDAQIPKFLLRPNGCTRYNYMVG